MEEAPEEKPCEACCREWFHGFYQRIYEIDASFVGVIEEWEGRTCAVPKAGRWPEQTGHACVHVTFIASVLFFQSLAPLLASLLHLFSFTGHPIFDSQNRFVASNLQVLDRSTCRCTCK